MQYAVLRKYGVAEDVKHVYLCTLYSVETQASMPFCPLFLHECMEEEYMEYMEFMPTDMPVDMRRYLYLPRLRPCLSPPFSPHSPLSR